MNFGQAIDAIKRGHKAACEGWNGKNWYHGDTIDIMLVHRGKALRILRYKKR